LHRAWLERWGENSLLVNAYHLDEGQAGLAWEALNRGRAAYAYGYASALAELALMWDVRGRRLSPGGLECVISTAEAMSPSQERLVETVFGAPVVREYGSTEFNEIAFECPDGGMHMNADRLLVEFIVEDGRPAAPGEPARIIITDLDNLATPLIRYPLGDWGSYTDAPCACGRTLPLLKDLSGREGDFLLLPGGGRSHAAVLASAMERAFDLCALPCLPWQVVQRSVDAVEVVLQEDTRSPILEARVRETLASLDPGFRVSFLYVQSLPRTPGGKRNRFVSAPS
jgi:phenylacetate-CoA ligase